MFNRPRSAVVTKFLRFRVLDIVLILLAGRFENIQDLTILERGRIPKGRKRYSVNQ